MDIHSCLIDTSHHIIYIICSFCVILCILLIITGFINGWVVLAIAIMITQETTVFTVIIILLSITVICCFIKDIGCCDRYCNQEQNQPDIPLDPRVDSSRNDAVPIQGQLSIQVDSIANISEDDRKPNQTNIIQSNSVSIEIGQN